MKYANIIHRNIKRYDIRKKEYENILIQNAIIKKRNHFNVLIKEFDIECIIDEYLKRGYKRKESKARIPQMANFYYKYLIFFGIPILRHSTFNNNMHSYATKKAENYYNLHCRKKEKEKVKGEIILTETVRETLENNKNDSFINDVNISKIKAMMISNRSKDEESIKTIIEMMDPIKGKIKKSDEDDVNLMSTVDKTKNDLISNINKKSRNRISKNSIEYNTVKSKQKKTYGSISKKKNNNKSTNVLNSFKTFDSKFKPQISQIVNKIKNQLSFKFSIKSFHNKPKQIQKQPQRPKTKSISPSKTMQSKKEILITNYVTNIKKELHKLNFTYGSLFSKLQYKSESSHQHLNTEIQNAKRPNISVGLRISSNDIKIKKKKNPISLIKKKNNFCVSYDKKGLSQLKYKTYH